MKIWIEYLNGEQKGERLDISKNLYWFEENFVKEVDEHGDCEGNHGDRYFIYIEESYST